ncbi:uncharacterized protein TRIADDRAFT_29583 [Trichoplax adhaerens]|uniref:G-protein coupled receptors family 3 profile domain-containing protein n=1 Tax=Trichoplax adhaerens TaxID=10228 RepID=B3S603_TRIAD|nr:hypothetical protein TRIADDRAFT_29583 [Trichoplax adhaerens]EDV22008.1 hypothetical protein TRIADDRAFT_29583 [Trichoplax adhaerens]|eukprot:XP_002115645.1 hypothetical protein TRIADDRAFT_29583 [Trichoplax adhaerens]
MGLSINYNEIIWNGGKKWDNIPISRCSDDCRPGYAVASGQYSNFQLLQCCWRCKKCKDQTISDTINQGSCEKCVNFTEANQNHTLCIDMPIAEINSRGSVAVILYLFTAFYLICWIFIYSTIVIYRKTPIIKASNFALLNIFQFFNLLSLPASLLSVLPITSIICAAQTILIALSEIGQLLTIICRANQIAIVFKKSLRRSRWRSTFVRNRSQVLFIILVSALSQLTIAALLIYRPVLVTKVINANNKIEMMCSYINNPALLVYGILFGLLNIIALVLAIQTRSLPDNYNEARYILLSAMMFTCVFSTSLPSILATTGLTNRKITSFSLFSTGVISMLCFLLPKMYIIYIHPEMNTPSQAAASVANYNFNHRGLVTPTSYQENSTASLLSSSVEPYRMKASPTQIQSNNDRKSTNNKDT